jgi:hypothetical protein
MIAHRHLTDRALKLASAELGMPVPSDHVPTEGTPRDSALARAGMAIESILAEAKHTRRIRPDLTLSDLVMILSAIPVGDGNTSTSERYLDIVLTGIRSPMTS